jgi:Zn-dependent protease with chaperone function/type II secretory pathway pseudopilin PulG
VAWLVLSVAALVSLPVVFLIYLFAQSALIAHLKGTAVRVTPRQFPDLHARLLACCERLGMARVPECYLLNGQGVFNAFATRFLGHHFVVLLSDVVDALDERPGALSFYIGHELAHIHRSHLAWRPVLLPGSVVPLLGAAYHRACESTCDLYGAACCAETGDALAGLTALAAGSKRWKGLSVDEYLGQAQESAGFWMSFHELVSDYPWLVKRAAQVVAFRGGSAPRAPGRHPLAYFLALFVPRLAGGGAGGFVSLLVLVAIVGIVAAIAIPSLLRARIGANEGVAVDELRSVLAAEVTFAGRHGHFTTLACLAGQPSCISQKANPPALPAALSTSTVRHGYRFGLDLNLEDAREFVYTAAPVERGVTGSRSFCTDASGGLYSATAGEQVRRPGQVACAPGLTRLAGR